MNENPNNQNWKRKTKLLEKIARKLGAAERIHREVFAWFCRACEQFLVADYPDITINSLEKVWEEHECELDSEVEELEEEPQNDNNWIGSCISYDDEGQESSRIDCYEPNLPELEEQEEKEEKEYE